MDFKVDIHQFDHFFDAVAAFDEQGIIVYCNDTFSQIVGLSVNRICNKKTTLAKMFLQIDDDLTALEKTQPEVATNTRVVSFKTKSISDGTAQYCLFPAVYDGKKFTLFVLRDLSLEEKLKKKYHREMASKDSKIEEMRSIITLLQQTRLVKDPNSIIREFALHILNQLRLDRAYLVAPDKKVDLIAPSPVEGQDQLIKNIQMSSLPDQYIAYAAQDLVNLKFGFVPNLETLVVIPVRAQQRSSYLLILPIFKGSSSALIIDHENIRTLAEQMSVILENMDLERMSIYDDLTKIYNARFFREKLDEYTKTYKKMSLILLDIDFFKKINDTYGHLAGDLVLTSMGQILQQVTARDGVVARVGGEEFAVLIPNQTPEQVMKLAEDLANQIRAMEVDFEGKPIKITSSFGISHWNGNMEVREFFKSADSALYKSKADGRNRITLYRAS